MKKIALVTGASRGIGSAIALKLASSGFLVIGTATTQSGADNISSLLKPFDGRGIVLNVIDSESIKSVIADINNNEGEIQILINNAGITQDNLLLRMTEEQWDSVINTNLKSLFLLTKPLIQKMSAKRYGRIVNITSVIAHTGNPGQANYAASKAGMIAFTKSIAKEYGSRNITANCVAPGFIDTDMTNMLNDKIKDSAINSIPLKRMGKPEDIANAVLYLVSESGDYVTGTVLDVNGGLF
jgi:3-oxoacyl-[acyl-carrier protein] reductase